MLSVKSFFVKMDFRKTVKLLMILITSLVVVNLYAFTGKYPYYTDSKIKEILDLNNLFEHAAVQSKKNSPLENIPPSLNLMIFALLNGDAKSIEQAVEANNKMLNEVKNAPDISAAHLYVKMRLYLNKSALHYLNKEIFSAVWNFYTTISLTSDLIHKYPDFAPAHTFGKLFNKTLAYAVEQEPRLIYFLPDTIKINPKLCEAKWSDFEQPLFNTILNCLASDPFDTTTHITEPETKAEAIICALSELNKHNPEQAVKTLDNLKVDSIILYSYIKGWANITIGNYGKAKELLQKYLQNKQHIIFKKSTLLGLYYIDIIENKTANRQWYIQRLSKLPDSYTYKDAVAKNEINADHNPPLLQARLLCDGGEYKKAIQILKTAQLNKLSKNHQQEYFYRFGRIYYLQNNLNEALNAYKKVLNNPTVSYSYYKAQAGYDCALISLKNNHVSAAEYYISLSMRFAAEASRNDIKYKAQALRNKMSETTFSGS